MRVLSEDAVNILGQMRPDRGYETSELMAFAGGLNSEAVRDVMRELWIAREVERFRESGWRRTRSTSGPRSTPQMVAVTSAAGGAHTGDAASLRIGTVRPEDLFDHRKFAGWFK